MPPILYLDANVYDHMVKGYIPQAEVNGLRAALRAGRLTARLSSADLVEILGHWETNRSAALARLRIARDLVGFQGLLKDPTEILREAVEAYAAGSQAAPVTLPEADRRYVVDHLVDVAAGSLRESPLMSEIIDDMRTRKKRLHTRMTEAKALAEKHLGDAVDMRESAETVVLAVPGCAVRVFPEGLPDGFFDRDHEFRLAGASGPWGGQRPSLADYVMVTGSTDGATAPRAAGAR